MRSTSAKCGHVKRHLNQGKQLTGELLEFALSLLPHESQETSSSSDELLGGIRRKLSAGESLTDYERHIFVDVILLHTRLSAGSRIQREGQNDDLPR